MLTEELKRLSDLGLNLQDLDRRVCQDLMSFILWHNKVGGVRPVKEDFCLPDYGGTLFEGEERKKEWIERGLRILTDGDNFTVIDGGYCLVEKEGVKHVP